MAYVPQAEEVDWSFPVLVEDVVTTGLSSREAIAAMIEARVWPFTAMTNGKPTNWEWNTLPKPALTQQKWPDFSIP